MENFPIEFTNSEYDKSLGLYQKFLAGNKLQNIEKLYSMSAFQLYNKQQGFIPSSEYHKYAEYMYLSISAILTNTTDWYVRVYIDESILHPLNPDMPLWKSKLQLLIQNDRVQLVCVKFPRYYLSIGCHPDLLAVMFRYLPLFDENVSVMLFRDIDNIYTNQHQYFVDKWLGRNDDICIYINEHYKRQQLCDITKNNIILENIYHNTILSGLWNIRKPFGTIFSKTIWQKMFAYTEDYTRCTTNPAYKNYKLYDTKFLYGFDELALTRVAFPIFIQMNLTIYTIPIRIYDIEFFKNMFENPALGKFLRNVSDNDTIEIIKKIMIDKYWEMYDENAGLAQYILCILTNIYFGIIMKKSPFYQNERLINTIKNKIIPNALLMAIGIFTFKNYNKYNWYHIDGKSSCGADVVNKFLTTNKKITLEEWTANSNLINVPQIPPQIPPPNTYNI